MARQFGSRAASFASEFYPFPAPEPDTSQNGTLIRIPAGYFVNWQHGARRLVPRSLSRFRARQMLLRAERNDRSVHYWIHPENLASAPETLDNLREIIAIAATMRNAGRCKILTQFDYCQVARETDPL